MYHVGKSKAQLAHGTALQFNPDVEVKAYHDSIVGTDFAVSIFKNFCALLNASDNRAARNHVNQNKKLSVQQENASLKRLTEEIKT
uniref:THIF-type NAD/FAD binding fold domain-containing protein n=1 Tax=Glossina austeni TaxID=7395 RepID=A0A1A9VTG8_GLOAU